MGNLGSDPEMRYTGSGTPVCSFSLATRTGWGERESTEWFRVSCWQKQAETAQMHLSKGDAVLVVGEFTTRSYTSSSGEERHSNEIRARELKFVTTKRSKNDAPKENERVDTQENENVENVPW